MATSNRLHAVLGQAYNMPMRTAVLTAVWALLCLRVVAQQNLPACDGEITVVRVSKIKPGGSMNGFMQAVAAHLAWYRSHGFKDNRIVAARVLEPESAGGKIGYSEKTVLTYHFNPPGMGNTPGRGDEAWKAYVKLYRDNSDIQSEYVTCMPKLQQ